MSKFEITNPEAIKLVNDLKSGAFFIPVKAWFLRYKWYFVSIAVVIFLLVALAVGRAISNRSRPPIFTPPVVGTVEPTQKPTVSSIYEWIREDIINYGTDLPDPIIPPIDNNISLESVNI